jgi:hypothetical protein
LEGSKDHNSAEMQQRPKISNQPLVQYGTTIGETDFMNNPKTH